MFYLNEVYCLNVNSVENGVNKVLIVFIIYILIVYFNKMVKWVKCWYDIIIKFWYLKY